MSIIQMHFLFLKKGLHTGFDLISATQIYLHLKKSNPNQIEENIFFCPIWCQLQTKISVQCLEGANLLFFVITTLHFVSTLALCIFISANLKQKELYFGSDDWSSLLHVFITTSFSSDS